MAAALLQPRTLQKTSGLACDICLHVPTGVGEYGPVEDIHLIANHLLTTYLAQKFAQYSVEQEGSPS